MHLWYWVCLFSCVFFLLFLFFLAFLVLPRENAIS